MACRVLFCRSRTLQFLLLAAVLFAMIDPSQGWLWSRRRRRQQCSCVAPTTNSFPYTHSTALRMIHYSTAAYASCDSIDSWSCKSCRYLGRFEDGTRYDRGWNTRVLVGYDPTLDAVVVAFRGTANWKNWLGNLAASLRRFPYGNGKVHSGMLRMYQGLRSPVIARVRQLLQQYQNDTETDIYVTGHSLGGAFATMAAFEFKRLFSSQVTMYNFGSPRVGNTCFVADYAKKVTRSIRVVNRGDPVPALPGRFLEYRHVPRQVTFPGGGHSTYLGVTR